MFQIETISAKMLDYYVERSDAVIIDLRDSAAYRRGHVRNAVNIPYRELEEYLEKKQDQKYRFPKDKLLIFYCDRGGASMQAARSLARQGCRKHMTRRRRRDWCFWEICFITDQEMTFRRNTHQRKSSAF